ncbi:MAG: hypothetical protein V5A21_13195 [Halapricum sp.]
MNAGELAGRWERLRKTVAESPLPQRAGRIVFGDWLGLALFLGALCYIAVLTRVGIFINDTYTTANAFVALTEGRLWVAEPFYGQSLNTPGMHVVDGKYYGRNYGQLALSLPAYWLLRGLNLIADLRIALTGAWSLLLLALSLVVGRLLDRRRVFALGGSGLALALFVASVAVATPIPDRVVPMLAMQLTSILAGALLVVLTYRLVALVVTRRAGIVAGVLVVFATPIPLWAPIPKRHVFTTMLVVLGLFAFAKSRDPETHRRDLVHGSAYAAAGLLAWIHAPEALVLFTAILLADLVTSPPARYRAIPTVAGVFLVSLLPFFVTNYLIAGHPILPPRLLRSAEAADLGTGSGGSGPGGGSPTPEPPGGNGTTTSESPESGSPGPLTILRGLLDGVIAAISVFVGLLGEGIDTIKNRTGQLYRTFVRSGYVSPHTPASDQPINLAVVESAPVLGALVALPAAAIANWSRPESVFDRLRQPAPATALALGLFATLFAVLYARRLPVHAQLTVRYLLPLYVVGVVAVAWVPPIERACREHTRTIAWTLSAGILLGGQIVVVAVHQFSLALGEAFQFHALLGLGLAIVLGASTLIAVFTERLDRIVAGLLGFTAAATAVFSLLIVTVYASGLGQYPVDGGQLLPIVRVLGDLVGAV